MAQRTDFGASWQDIEAEWCLDSPLPISPDAAWSALGTLERLWPEYLDEVLARGAKGPSVMAAVIARGHVLTACESLQRFGPVLTRIKNPATFQAAWPEAIVAAAFVKLGYVPEFEPSLNDKKADLLVVANGADVYVEVIAPQESREFKHDLQTVETLTVNLCGSMNGTRLEILLEVPADHQAAIEAFMHATQPNGSVHHLSGIGLLRYERLGSDVANAGPTIESDVRCPVTGVARARVQGGRVEALVVVRFPFEDSRAQRLIDRELRHFPRNTPNLLVISVSGNPGAGVRPWVPLVQRRLQPTQNRRLGAVALFSQGIDVGTAAIYQQWSVVRNDHALYPMPQGFLDNIARLDNSL